MRNKMRRLKAVFGAMVIAGTMLVGPVMQVNAAWQTKYETSWTTNSESDMCALRRATNVDVPRTEALKTVMSLQGDVVNRYHHNINVNSGYIDAAHIKSDDLDISIGFDYTIDGSKITITDVYGVVSGINSDVENGLDDVGANCLIIPDAVTLNGYTSYSGDQLTVQDLIDINKIKTDTGVFKNVNNVLMSTAIRDKLSSEELEIRRVVLDTESVKQMNANKYYEIKLGMYVDDFNLQAEFNDDNDIGVENVTEIKVDEANPYYYSKNSMLFAKATSMISGITGTPDGEITSSGPITYDTLVWCPPEIRMCGQDSRTSWKHYKRTTGEDYTKIVISGAHNVLDTAFDNLNMNENYEIVFDDDVRNVNIAAERMKSLPAAIKINSSTTNCVATGSSDKKLFIKQWCPEGYVGDICTMDADSDVIVRKVERRLYDMDVNSSAYIMDNESDGNRYCYSFECEVYKGNDGMVVDIVDYAVEAEGCCVIDTRPLAGFDIGYSISCADKIKTSDVMADFNSDNSGLNVVWLYDSSMADYMYVDSMNIVTNIVDEFMSSNRFDQTFINMFIPAHISHIEFTGDMNDISKWLSSVAVDPSNDCAKVEQTNCNEYIVSDGFNSYHLYAGRAIAPPLDGSEINESVVYRDGLQNVNINGNLVDISYTYCKSYDETIAYPQKIDAVITGASGKTSSDGVFITINDAAVIKTVSDNIASKSMSVTDASTNSDIVDINILTNYDFCDSMEDYGYTHLYVSEDIIDVIGIQSSARVNKLFENITVNGNSTTLKMAGQCNNELMSITRGVVVMTEKIITTETVKTILSDSFVAEDASICIDNVYYAPVFDFNVTQTQVSNNLGATYMRNDTTINITGMGYTVVDVNAPKYDINTMISFKEGLRGCNFAYVNGTYREPEKVLTDIKSYVSTLDGISAGVNDITLKVGEITRFKWQTDENAGIFKLKYVQPDFSKFKTNLNKWDTVKCSDSTSVGLISNARSCNIVKDDTLVQLRSKRNQYFKNSVFGSNASYKDVEPGIVIDAAKISDDNSDFTMFTMVSDMKRNANGSAHIVFGPKASDISYIDDLITHDIYADTSIITVLNKNADIGDMINTSNMTNVVEKIDETGKTVKIQGYEDSTAEYYANALGLEFIPIPEKSAACAKTFLNRNVLGDADNDNAVTLADTVRTVKYNVAHDIYPMSLQGLLDADMNDDGDVDMADVHTMIEMNLGNVDYEALCEKYK